ncbi:TetR/AcrR family transcriptional regulator [Intestinibacter sp.]
MPLIVDKEAIKLEIIEAFQRLSNSKPVTAISLREIAAEAGISHSKILRYFHDKNTLLVACVHWASSHIYNTIEQWFQDNHLKDYRSKQEYLDALFEYFQIEEISGISSQNVVMICALGAYSDEIRGAVREEFERINKLFYECISLEIGEKISIESAKSLAIIFYGIYFSKFNESISKEEVCKPILNLESILK